MEKEKGGNENKKMYSPSEQDSKLIERIYDEFKDMRDVSSMPYRYFNDRTLTQFIDDAEKRFNSYVPTRSSQRKESWQSNFFHPTTRNKTIAILASVALDVPKLRVVSRNEKNEVNMKIGNIISDLVKGSYDNENKEENLFFEALECIVKGTVIVGESNLKTKVKQKIITSYDVVTGEIEVEDKDVLIDKGCRDFIVPSENFFISNAYIRDIQMQPACIWVQYMDDDAFEYEFSNFNNFKYVMEGSLMLDKDIQKRFFYEKWADRTKKEPYEIVRYYNKFKDEHIILVNGVKMFEGPLLLGKKEKYYPFSKSIYSPFAEAFFWGNNLPNMMMGEQDVINSLYNMSLDKTYKSLVTNLLIGMVNKDGFDLEDDEVSLDTKIYVQDINQVKELANSGVTQSEIKMIDLVAKGLDLSSVDTAQQGVSLGGRTAREVVIANENARKLKGIFFMFITSLWFQKTKLRTLNILTYYTTKQVTDIIGESKEKQFKKFIISNTELSDGTRGDKGIIIASDKKNLPNKSEIDRNVDEYKSINKNSNYEEIAVTSDYINEWEHEIKIVTETVYNNDSSYAISKNEDKLKTIATLFPTYFDLNKEKLFKDTLVSYEDDIDEYDLEQNKSQQQPTEGSSDGSNNADVQNKENAGVSQLDISNLPKTMQ